MDPIRKSHPKETAHPPKSGSGSPSPVKRKINDVSSGAISSNPLDKKPSIAEKVVTSSADLSDANFVTSLIVRCRAEIPMRLNDEDFRRIETIHETVKQLPVDGIKENEELKKSLSRLYKNSDFLKAITKQELKNIQNDKIAFDNIKQSKTPSLKDINDLLTIFSNQTDKKCLLYESAKSLIDELSTYIQGHAFQSSVREKLYSNKDELDETTLENILKLPIVNEDFKESIEMRLEKHLGLNDEVHISFIESLTFDQLIEMFNADTDYRIIVEEKSLTRNDCICIFDEFSYTFCDHLENLIKANDPIQAIDLLQRLEIELEEEELLLSENIIDLETEASARLFIDRKEAIGGISQVNFKDDGLAIAEGGANFCCGSIAVEALVAKLANRTIEDVIKNGVIRHLKLPKEQMSTLTTVSMLIENNKDIKDNGAQIRKSLNPNKTLYSGYLDLLTMIPKGSSGLILANIAFLMYTENPDGSIEIFDSHGSSIPLITGVTHPAYRAFFKDKSSAAAYLSVHRKVDIDRSLSFFPLEIIPS